MLRLLFLSLPFLSVGCDVADFKFPEVPKHDKSDSQQDASDTMNIPVNKKSVSNFEPKTHNGKQDPDKDYNKVNASITRGQPIHSFPSEN